MWNSFINGLTKFDSVLNGIVWGWPVIILILGTGLLLTIRTGALQITHFRESFNSTIVPAVKGIGKKRDNGNDKTISQFEAFSAAISGTVGTGNIIGVVAAILTGGPGAVLWMWISAFFGMVTNYAENVLGLYYRQKNEDGSFSGGAMYYISLGLKQKWLGYLAAIFCMTAAIGMGGVQTNKISGTVSDALSNLFTFSNMTVVKLVIGIIVAAVTALVILGGIKRIGKISSMLVPFMSVLFILISAIAIIMHIDRLPAAFGMIFGHAFNFKAAGGGIMGYAFSQIIKKGMARGVFSNEAGLGSSVIAHSASDTREPVKQGLWGVFEVFLDTFVICTITALTMLCTLDVASLTGAESDAAIAMSVYSSNFGGFGTVCFSIILPLFAFTTIVAWSYYGEKATEFCFSSLGNKGKKVAAQVFKVIYLLMIAAAAVIESDLVWSIDDTCNGLMALPNLIALIFMSGLVVKITKNYFDRKKGLAVEPMLSADPKLNEEFKNDIASGKKEYL